MHILSTTIKTNSFQLQFTWWILLLVLNSLISSGDIDFKHKVPREKLLELIEDWLSRVTGPVERALATSAMSMENIDQVIIIGGGSRVPKVQELLTAHVGKELAKNLNADESAALGSVYRTADISTGFKVKKFITKSLAKTVTVSQSQT